MGNGEGIVGPLPYKCEFVWQQQPSLLFATY